MAPGSRRLQVNRTETLLNPPRLASDMWLRAGTPMNHRFDKLGNPLPLELHGCGCGLCARRQRSVLNFWEAR